MFRCSNGHELHADDIICETHTLYDANVPECGVPENIYKCLICGDDYIEEIKERNDY